jgi:hypothetical protein
VAFGLASAQADDVRANGSVLLNLIFGSS